MWLSSSSVGRKLVMAFSGAALLLFVTFHCLLNAIAICWPTTYNSVCLFLGANWYALLASIVLCALIVIHIIYACMLTVRNRQARGPVGYSISKRPASVEWSSKNMLVLGIVILAFLVVHLIQFWAKMQMAEIGGMEEVIPPSAGTLFIQEAFGLVWTPIVYIIGFVALWFHMNHGFWSMFHSTGWDNQTWLPRLKKIGCWWTTIVVGLFIAQAIVFTVHAANKYYITNPELQAQYSETLDELAEKNGTEFQDELSLFISELQRTMTAGNMEATHNKEREFLEKTAVPFLLKSQIILKAYETQCPDVMSMQEQQLRKLYTDYIGLCTSPMYNITLPEELRSDAPTINQM